MFYVRRPPRHATRTAADRPQSRPTSGSRNRSGKHGQLLHDVVYNMIKSAGDGRVSSTVHV